MMQKTTIQRLIGIGLVVKKSAFIIPGIFFLFSFVTTEFEGFVTAEVQSSYINESVVKHLNNNINTYNSQHHNYSVLDNINTKTHFELPY